MAKPPSNPGASGHLAAPTYTSDFSIFDERSAFMRRRIERHDLDIYWDVQAAYWSFHVERHDKLGQVSFWHQGKLRSFRGTVGVFLPPFSLVEVHVQPGRFDFEAVLSVAPCPADLPLKPVAFPLSSARMPPTVAAIFDCVRAGQKDACVIAREDGSSAVARRLKERLDQTFAESTSLTDVATALGLPHATMTRAFRRVYGLSPVQYRAKLRVMDSLRRFFSGESLTSAAQSSGFHDLSQYYRQFYKETLLTPARFHEAVQAFGVGGEPDHGRGDAPVKVPAPARRPGRDTDLH